MSVSAAKLKVELNSVLTVGTKVWYNDTPNDAVSLMAYTYVEGEGFEHIVFLTPHVETSRLNIIAH